MSLVRVRFEVVNGAQFSRAFEGAAEKVKDMSLPFNLILDEFYDSMTEVFESEGEFEGRPRWQELSPAYRKWKERHYPGRKILELTGRLKSSLTTRGGSDNITEVAPDHMTVGSRVPWGIYHQTGTSKMPQRVIIELTKNQFGRWTQFIHKYLFGIYDQAAKETRGGV